MFLLTSVFVLDSRPALQSAWNVEYKGHAHELLAESINQLELKGPYSNQISIIQSSGTGKSRMVHEQARLVCTIPLNLREKSADRGQLYYSSSKRHSPHSRSGPRQCCSRLSHCADIRNITHSREPLIPALFVVVKNRLSSLTQQRGKKWSDNCELAHVWRGHLEDTSGTEDVSNRAALYQTVIQEIRPVSGVSLHRSFSPAFISIFLPEA